MAKLSEFVGKRSWLMFQLLEVDAAMWLEEPAAHWSEIPSYVRFERLVKGMTLVNYCTERGIRDMEEFIKYAKDAAA